MMPRSARERSGHHEQPGGSAVARGATKDPPSNKATNAKSRPNCKRGRINLAIDGDAGCGGYRHNNQRLIVGARDVAVVADSDAFTGRMRSGRRISSAGQNAATQPIIWPGDLRAVHGNGLYRNFVKPRE